MLSGNAAASTDRLSSNVPSTCLRDIEPEYPRLLSPVLFWHALITPSQICSIVPPWSKRHNVEINPITGFLNILLLPTSSHISALPTSVPVSRFECVSGLSVYWPIIALGTRECGVSKLCRDPTVKYEFFLRGSLLKTFN